MKDKRVAVLLGGMSSERGVSLKSGAAVAEALRRRGYDTVEIDVGPDLPERLRATGAQVAWIALHGAYGEDGCVQGLLEVMGIPYTGSGVQGSAIAMDKVATKRMLRGSGISLAPDLVWRRGDPLPNLRYPLFAKQPNGGSTLGIHRVEGPEQLQEALDDLTRDGGPVLVEQGVQGYEITVAVLFGRALPVVAIQPVEGFFDYEAKYVKGKTKYVVPAPIPDAVAERAQRDALLAYQALGLSGVARSDFIVDADGVPWFLEINTLPGMTQTSLSPMAAGEVGMSFDDLVEELLRGASLKTRGVRPE